MSFGEKLSDLRRSAHMTQENFADFLGVSRQSVSKWESDLAYPETDKIVAIAKLFGVTTDYLLMEDAAPEATDSPARDPLNENAEKSGAQTGRFLKKLPEFEYRSERTVHGKPLIHIHVGAGFCKANGVIAIGNIASGAIAVGLLARGGLCLGVFSLGLLAFGAGAIGLLAVAALSMGVIAIGAVAMGMFAIGAIALGLFSIGALACGVYGAAGDIASGAVAIGCRSANGRLYGVESGMPALFRFDFETVAHALEGQVPGVFSPLKKLFLLALKCLRQ